jgi:hypothetical protein
MLRDQLCEVLSSCTNPVRPRNILSNLESGRDGSASRWMVVLCTAYAAENMETAAPNSNGFANDLDCLEVCVIHERDHDELKIASGRRN